MNTKQFAIRSLIPRDLRTSGASVLLDVDRFLVVVDGVLQIIDKEKSLVFQSGELACIDMEISHTFESEDGAKFLTFSSDFFLANEEGIWGPKIALQNYDVYEIVQGHDTQGKWSAALIDIGDSPKHFHLVEKEHFIVVRGNLHIEVDGIHQELNVGEHISISPGQIHKLTSTGQDPVRVLCLSIPAFTPQDMFLVEE
ncbi:MAG: cupin domain-containing protein [Rhabdochlamydiaceae bacterium]|nr:cupin domain-containing protein [Rhabdochlamydiaceae bacterium]